MDRLIPQEAKIYFPEMIGCRLAGDNWGKSWNMQSRFKNMPNIASHLISQ